MNKPKDLKFFQLLLDGAALELEVKIHRDAMPDLIQRFLDKCAEDEDKSPYYEGKMITAFIAFQYKTNPHLFEVGR